MVKIPAGPTTTDRKEIVMAVHSLPGTYVPVTAFVRASAYAGPQDAFRSYAKAKALADSTGARLRELERQGRELFPGVVFIPNRRSFPKGGDWYGFEKWDDEFYEDARLAHEIALDDLAGVEQAMGIYHPEARNRLASFVEGALALLDATDGDPDAEDADEREPDPESAGDPAWIEWHTRGRTKLWREGELLARHDHGGAAHEDHEDDDPAGQYDEDCYTGPAPRGHGPGCTISDPDFCMAGDDRITSGPSMGGYIVDTGAGDEDDAEHWAQTDNVPMPKVVSAEHNIFTDERVDLGRTNLQSSFRTNGNEVRSADTGRILRTKAERGRPKPGKPV